MKTLIPTKAWILICSIIIVSSATEHGTSHHDGSHLGDDSSWKKYQNTIVPVGIQTPDHVLLAPDLSCISADDNIFEIMDKAQASCNGTDMRCTFYHFINHNYDKIGTLDINKEKFDDLLMKFDKWLLTDEKIEEVGGKIKEGHVLEGKNGNLNENSLHPSDLKGVDGAKDAYVGILDHNTDTDDDAVHSHHNKPPHETHHKSHHSKDHDSLTASLKKHWKDGKYGNIDPEFNSEHQYFEVYLPKDKVTGKPRTIYVEVDNHKNEFVLIDEEIDKKLKGIKPIRIELDELSEIADTAFNEVSKSKIFKEHIHIHLNDDEKAMISDISKSGEHEGKIHLDVDLDEHAHDNINSSDHHSDIKIIDAEQQVISDDTTDKDSKIINISLLGPNADINPAQFNIKSYMDNTTNNKINNDLDLLENNHTETDIYTDFHVEEHPHVTTEFDEVNIHTDLDLHGAENSDLDHIDIPHDNDHDNTTEYHDWSIEHENATVNDDHELDEHNDTVHENDYDDTSHEIDHDDTQDLSTPHTIHLNESTAQIETPIHEIKPKLTPEMDTKPEITSSVASTISDFSGSPVYVMPSENRRKGQINLHNVMSESTSSNNTVPVPRKVLETGSNLQSSPPAYATTDLHKDSSLSSVEEHPAISSYNPPLDSVVTPPAASRKCQYPSLIMPLPPVECVVKYNQGTDSSPFNFGLSWLPSYSRIEELRLPCALNPLSSDSGVPSDPISSLPVSSMKYPGDSQLSSGQSIPSISQSSLPISSAVQEPALSITPCDSESAVPTPPKYVLLSKLGLPKSKTDFDRISPTIPLPVTPCIKNAINSPYSIQPIPPCLKQTRPCPIDSGLNIKSPFDRNTKETMIPYSPYTNRHPYSTNPYFSNPYLVSPQFISPYLESFSPVSALQPSKTPTLDSSSISLDNSYPCLARDYPREVNPTPFLPYAPNYQFSPLNPLLLEPSFAPNALPWPNAWNNMPYVPYPDQNIRNNFVQKYLNPNIDQIQRPCLLKEVPVSMTQPCLSNNNLEITPSSYKPCLPVQTASVPQELSPSVVALGHDLENLSLKYGIPLSNILNSLEKEISDGNTYSATLEAPHSGLEIEKGKKITTKTVNEHRSADRFKILDSSLIGPHLDVGKSQMLDSNDSHGYTVSSENIGPVTPHLNGETHFTKVIHDSSLIGPKLSTITSSDINLSDVNRNEAEVVVSESGSYNSMHLDSSDISPHLEIGHPSVGLGSSTSQGNLLTSYSDVPHAILSEVDSSLTGSHFPSLSPAKPLMSNEVQSFNEIVPLDLDLNHEITKTEIVQHERATVKSSSTTKPPEYLPKNSVDEKLLIETAEYVPTHLKGEEIQLKSDSSSYIPLDFSLIGPELKTGSLPIVIDTSKDTTIPVVSQNNLQNTLTKHEESESIILPSSFLPTVLDKPVKADSNLNIITQDAKLNAKHDELSLDNYTEVPLTDIPHINVKETDFKIVETIPNLYVDNVISPLSKDSTSIKYISQAPEMSLIHSGTPLESTFIGPSILPKAETPVVSSTLDSSTYLDHSLKSPSIKHELHSETPNIVQETSIGATNIDPSIRPSNAKGINSKYHLDTSLIGPSLNRDLKSQGATIAFDSATQLDSSLLPPSLYELGTESSVLNGKSELGSSLVKPSLHQIYESSAASPASIFDSSLIGRGLQPAIDNEEVTRGSKKVLDSSLIGSHLPIVPFSSDEVKMINAELQPKSGLSNGKLLDSSLRGPHLDFGKSEISRYDNKETFLTSDTVPGILETLDFLNSDVVVRDKPIPNTESTTCSSELQELLAKFKNSITKSQLLESECKPCDKLLASIAKQSPDNMNYMSPPCSDSQSLNFNTLLNTPLSLQDYSVSEYSPTSIVCQDKEFILNRPIVKRPCVETNNFFTPQMLPQLLPYAQGVPQIPFSPYSPFVPINSLMDHNWVVPKPFNIQNVQQSSPTSTPLVLTPEDMKLLLDFASHSTINPQLIDSNMYSPKDVIPSSEWNKPSNVLSLDKYISSLPKKVVAPSHLESTICNSEFTPTEAKHISSLLDDNSYKLLQDFSVLPCSPSPLKPTAPMVGISEFASPSSLATPILNSDFMETRPVLPIPITNPMVTPSIYVNPQTGLYYPQNIPYVVPASNIPPYKLQPYSYTPLDSELSEIVPKIESLSIESPKSFLQSPLHEIPNSPQLIESIPNSKEFLQQQLLKSPIILPSTLSDSMLQLPAALSGSKRFPWQSSPVYLSPISPISITPLKKAYTSPKLPGYFSPSLESYATSISPLTTSLPVNIPYAASPLTPISLPFNPYTASSVIPDVPSLKVQTLKSMPLSNYAIAPLEICNRPVSSVIPYKQSQMYSSPYLPVHTSLLPIENSPYSPVFTSKLTPTSSLTPVFYEPLPTPYNVLPIPKPLATVASPVYSNPLTPITTSPMVTTPPGMLSPAYVSPGISTYKYSPMDTINLSSNLLSPASITPVSPVSSNLPPCRGTLPSKSVFNLKPAKIPQELENVKLLNTLPISYANNPFLNSNQMLPINPNILQSYHEYIPKISPLTSPQLKQNKLSNDNIGSNLQFIDENVCTSVYNNEGDKYYEEHPSKHPLESLAYTLAPEEIKELPNDGFIKQEDLIPCAPLTDIASEPSLHPKLYQRPILTPYTTPLYGKSSYRPCQTPQFLSPSSLFETVPQYLPLLPLKIPLGHPASLPATVLSSPLLKPLEPFTPVTNLPILSTPCIDKALMPYKKLPMDNNLAFSSIYNSAPGQGIISTPYIDVRELRKIISPQLTPVCSQVPIHAPFVSYASPITSSISKLPSPSYNLDNYIELPLTYNQPNSKTLMSQIPLVKPSIGPSYNQYVAPTISHIPLSQIPITSSNISPLLPSESLTQSLLSPQHIASVLPAPTTLPNSIPLYETPIHYQPYVSPNRLVNPEKHICKSLPVTSPYTVLPMASIIEPVSADFISPQYSSYLPHTLTIAPVPTPKLSSLNSPSNVYYTTITPDVAKQALANHLMASPLYMSPDINFQTTPLIKSSPLNNIPRYNYPLPTLIEPLEILPYVAPSQFLGPPILPQNRLKPITKYSKGKYSALPLTSSPYLAPLEMLDSYQTQPLSNVQYTKPCPKLLPAQYASSSFEPSYTTLPLESVPISQINKPRLPQYSLPTASVYNIPSYTSVLAKNPFLNANFKPMQELAQCPVSSYQISPLKFTPSESISLSNLRPLDIFQENLQSITSSMPLPLSTTSRQHQPQMIPINAQYIPESPTHVEFLPSDSPLLQIPLLKPLLTTTPKYSSVPTMPCSNLNRAYAGSSPMKPLPSSMSYRECSGPEPLVSQLFETLEPVTPSTTPYRLLKPAFNKQHQSPISMPLYSNYEILESSPKLPMKVNNINTVRPVEISATSSVESILLPLDSLKTEMVEKIGPYTLIPKPEDKLSRLPMNINQQRQYYNALPSNYLTMPQQTHIPSKFETLRPKPSFSVPSVIPEDVELIDTTGFIPISPVQSESESLVSTYSPIDMKTPISNTLSNTQESNTLPSSPYTVLSNSEFSASTYKHISAESLKDLPSNLSELDLSQFAPYTTAETDISLASYKNIPPAIQKPRYSYQQPVHLSPQEYEELIQSLSAPSSSSSTYTELPLTRGPHPMPMTPLYASPLSMEHVNELQFSKPSPHQEIPVEVTPEIENILALLNNYRPVNKITPPGVNSYAYEPKYTIVETPLQLDSVKPLVKQNAAYTEYTEASKPIEEHAHFTEPDYISANENEPHNIEGTTTQSLPEIIKGFSVLNYNENNNAQRPQRLSKSDHFYTNHIGQTPQVQPVEFVPTYNTDSNIDVTSPSTSLYPEILKDLSKVPTKYFGSAPKLNRTFLRPNEFYPEIAQPAKNVLNTISYPENYFTPYSQMKLPTNTIDTTDTSGIPISYIDTETVSLHRPTAGPKPASYNSFNNIDDIKYSGYKTYQSPSLKAHEKYQNLETPTQGYIPPFVSYAPIDSAAISSIKYHSPTSSEFYELSETSEPFIPQYETLEKFTTPLQTKIDLNTLKESPEFIEYREPEISRYQIPEKLTTPLQTKLDLNSLQENPEWSKYSSVEDKTVCINSIKEDNDLKNSVINYINKRDEIRSNLDNNNYEFTIPLGNIAITKKEPYTAQTIQTNNPSIGLKVWKSNVKIAQAELKLKFKDLSVLNFMPVVNNLNKYDIEEIRKIVKNYIDEKYGNHIEIHDPYTVDNQYTVVKDFDPNAVGNKFNLLWPTNYV